MTVAALIAEAGELTSASIRFAKNIDHATTGDRLGRIMREAMDKNPGPYQAVRAAVQGRVDELGGAGQAAGLFMLAADMATTAAIGGDTVDESDQRELRRLWDDLLRA